MAKKTKAKISKWDYIKLERFCTIKESMAEIKWHSTECIKVFAHYMSGKRLILKIYKHSQNSTTKKPIATLKNGQRRTLS